MQQQQQQQQQDTKLSENKVAGASQKSVQSLMNQSSNLFSSLNFDYDNELQNLAGMGDDGDLPDVFWDYGDVGNIAYSEDGGSITASSLGMEPFTTQNNRCQYLQKSSSSMGPTVGEDSATPLQNEQTSPATEPNVNPKQGENKIESHDKNIQQVAQKEPDNRMNTAHGNTMTSWASMVPQVQNPMSLASYPSSQLAGNFCGLNPFLLSSSSDQNQDGRRSFSQNSLTSSMFHTGEGQGGGSCSLPSEVGNSVNAVSNQQQQAQQQQFFQGSYFGLPQAQQFNAQFTAWQANNQIQKLNEYIQQQLQVRNNLQQQQFLQQQLFSNAGGMLSSNNQMLPPPQQQKMMQNQGQVRLQTPQIQPKRYGGTAPALLPLQGGEQASNGSKIQQQQQQQQQQQRIIQPNTQQRITSKSQLNSVVQGPDKVVSQSCPPQSQHVSASNVHQNRGMAQLHHAQQVANMQNMNYFSRDFLQPPVTTSLPNTTLKSKSNIVSCSDTDGDHSSDHARIVTTSLTRNKRSPTLAPSTTKATKNEGYSVDFFDDQQMENHEDDDDECSESRKNEELMTEEEKAVANRKRNREHARNTRARKKAYLESLKTTLDELCRERDSLVSERVGAASMLLEVQKTRTDVLLSFFALRCKYEKKRALWSSILDESFTCVMPVTPYRSFPASEVQISKCQRTVMGVDGIISDTASLHVLLNTLVDRSRFPNGKVEFRYTLIAEEAVVSGSQMMARWSLNTTNAIALGAKREVKKMGMLCARFSSSHKIVSLELMFDVMAFMLQLKQSSGNRSFVIVPNTVQTCTGCFENYPMVMTLADRPYTIVQVNKEWEAMTGWAAEDVVGKQSCKILQGDDTEENAVKNLTSSILFQRPDFCILTNYTRERQKMFRNFFNIYPLSTDSKITHYVGLTVHIEWLDSKVKPRKTNLTKASNYNLLDNDKIGTKLGTDLQDNNSSSIDSGSDNGPTKVSASILSSCNESADDKKSSLPCTDHHLGDLRN
jgi:PAS domain S-box